MCAVAVPNRFMTAMMTNKNKIIETVMHLSVKPKLPEIVALLFVTGRVEARNNFHDSIDVTRGRTEARNRNYILFPCAIVNLFM